MYKSPSASTINASLTAFELAGRFSTAATLPRTLIEVPGEPCEPVGPVGPVAPNAPLGPVGPVAPPNSDVPTSTQKSS